MAKRPRLAAALEEFFGILERCWPGVVGGLITGVLVTTVGGALFGTVAALAGTLGSTWLHQTHGPRGRRRRQASLLDTATESVSALIIVGAVFAAVILLSWAKWLLVLAVMGLIGWLYLMG